MLSTQHRAISRIPQAPLTEPSRELADPRRHWLSHIASQSCPLNDWHIPGIRKGPVAYGVHDGLHCFSSEPHDPTLDGIGMAAPSEVRGVPAWRLRRRS
jgi:hypothetical protein